MNAATPSRIEFQILLALTAQDRHGYGIMQQIARQTNQTIRVGPGALYGALKRMIKTGWVAERAAARSPGQDPRRTSYYRLTPAGRKAAAEAARQMADLVSIAARLGLVAPEAAR